MFPFKLSTVRSKYLYSYIQVFIYTYPSLRASKIQLFSHFKVQVFMKRTFLYKFYMVRIIVPQEQSSSFVFITQV